MVLLHNRVNEIDLYFFDRSCTEKQLLSFATISAWSSINMWRQRKELDTSIYTNVYKDTTNRLYGIWNLLLRWKCSVFKLIWHDLVVFLVLYFALSILYRYTG